MTKLTEHYLLGQDLVLTSERAVFWRQEKMLIVADPHFGKAQYFREIGIPVPSGTTSCDLDRLSRLISGFDPVQLLFLGDLTHDRIARPTAFNRLIDSWRNRHIKLKLMLASGNHDRRSGSPPASFRFEHVAEIIQLGPFSFSHNPEVVNANYCISGHLHPAVSLKGKGRQKETLPCFYFSRKFAVLPSFGSFTGNQLIQPAFEDRVYVIAGEEVIEVWGDDKNVD
jgi:DNA ligase-associated metallophosphoesterase